MKMNQGRIDRGMSGMRTMTVGLILAAAGCGVDGVPETGDPAGTESAAAAVFNPPSLSAEDDQALNLRATVEFPNRAVVKFYEPEDGFIVISEAGRNGNPPVITKDMKKLSAVDIYERLSNQKAPLALVNAVAHASLLRQRPVAPTREAAAADTTPSLLRATTAGATKVIGDIQQVTSALTFANGYDQWFYDNFCEGGVNVGDWSWGVRWMFVSGSGNFRRNDNNYVSSTVSVYGGVSVHNKVEIMPWYTWSTPKDLFIQSGYYYGYSRLDFAVDFDFRVTVDQAAGDSYHLCAYGDN